MEGQRVLVLGATGMLGHKLWQVLGRDFDVWATARRVPAHLRSALFDSEKLIEGPDALELSSIASVIESLQPQVVVNAIGIVKQLPTATDAVLSIRLNALLPHELAATCRRAGARFIHVSTDCVFSGRTGAYVEEDIPDPVDLYGRSKLLGEVEADGALTLRTSIIGRELESAHSLLEWFLSNAGGSVRGFTGAVYSGVPTVVLADLVGALIAHHPDLTGLYHLSSEPITKHDLLRLIGDAYGVEVEIRPTASPEIDRSLDSTKFRKATGLGVDPWDRLVHTMAADPTPYDRLRGSSDA